MNSPGMLLRLIGDVRRSPLWWSLLIAGMLVVLMALPAHADVGPKPSMVFRFSYQIPQVAITSGRQMECNDANCSDAAPLTEIGPQRFWCEEHECRSMTYSYAYYHRLVITFADGVTRESNVFATQGRGGDFDVTVAEDRLIVQLEEPFVSLFRMLGQAAGCVPAGALTLVIETLVAGVFVSVLGLPRALLGAVPVASLFTLPVVWFVSPLLPVPWQAAIGLTELFAVVGEAGIVYAFTHWTLSLRRVAVLSLTMNAVSFGAGLLIALPG